jgi:excisionase family DNA binding protein
MTKCDRQTGKKKNVKNRYRKNLEAQRRALAKADPSKEVMNLCDVMKLLGMSAPALRNAIHRGIIPGVKIGTKFRFSKEAILKALDVKQNPKEQTGKNKGE